MQEVDHIVQSSIPMNDLDLRIRREEQHEAVLSGSVKDKWVWVTPVPPEEGFSFVALIKHRPVGACS